ncbi:hypothetical protein PYCC9005_002952 [Savitreella phatthalungensis]
MGVQEYLGFGGPKRALDNGSVLVSGAYPRRGPKVKQVEALAIQLARRIAQRDGSLVSGNGPVIGNALVEGLRQVKGSEAFQYITIVPFKQHGTVAEMTHSQRSEYFYQVRQDLISKANIMVFLSGEKMSATEGTTTNSDTVFAEFSMGTDLHRWPIPIATLGGSAAAIHGRISTDIKRRAHPYKDLEPGLWDKLADSNLSCEQVVDAVFAIADWIVETKLNATLPRSRRSSVSSQSGAAASASSPPSTTATQASVTSPHAHVFGQRDTTILPHRLHTRSATSLTYAHEPDSPVAARAQSSGIATARQALAMTAGMSPEQTK